MANSAVQHRWQRVAAFALAVVLMFTVAVIPPAVKADTDEESTASRLIHVVYDDSNSMIMDKSTAWSEAKYSLEILSAMMQEKDIMNVYFMSDFNEQSGSGKNGGPRLKNLSGAASQRQANIQKIHNTVTATNGTFFSSIKKAYNDLKADGKGYDEQHLVVITDGDSFYNYENASNLNSLFKDAQKDGIKVVYLAIGQNAIKPTANNTSVFVYEAAPNSPGSKESILQRVTEIGERIFQRPAHPLSGNALNLKIPVSEIVVFAQGANVSVGDIPGTKKSLSSAGLTMADRDKATTWPNNDLIRGIDNIVVADGLAGMVATFTPASGEYIAEGTYQLDVSATAYTVYYKPCLDVVLELTDADGTRIEDGAEVNIGNYTANYFLTYPKGHPNHGQKADLAGLGIDPKYSLLVDTGGKIKTYEGGAPQTVELTEGKTRVTIIAQYLTYISTDTSINLAVADLKIYPLITELTPEKKEYILSEMEDDREGYTLKVRMEDGSPVPDTLWAACQVTVNCEGLDFEAKKNSDGTFTLLPRRKNGKYEDTGSGELPFTAVATVTEDGRVTYKGSDEGVADIYNDVIPDKNGFAVEIVKINPGEIKSTNFNGVTPTAQVQVTWNGNPLTKAQYEALELTAVMKKEYLCTDASGNEVPLLRVTGVELDPYAEGQATTATVSFEAQGDPETQRKKLASHDTFQVTAVIDREGVRNEATAEGELGVKRVLSLWEILGIILAILLFLFILFGYIICKKWLPKKIKYANATTTRTFKPYTKPSCWLSILVPFLGVTVRMKVDYFDATGINSSTSLRIRATGKNTSAILNAVELYRDGNIYVDSDTRLATYLDALQNGRNRPRKKPVGKLNYRSSHLYKAGDDLVTFLGTKDRKKRKK
ncbi:MAG: VWA domain-containing protein [Clostridia bacterium]|nr:VWA domain-containing protein [Clostridia bacterium]